MSYLIKNEKNEDIIAVTLRQMQGIISNYIPLKYYEKYTSILFDVIADILARQVTLYNSGDKSSKELILHLIDNLISFAYTEDHIAFLKNWLTTNPSIQNVSIDNSLLTQDNRFKILKHIFRSRIIADSEKEDLLKIEIERDNNSDRALRAKLTCYASQPKKEVKNELWNKFVYQSTSDSLYNMEAFMSGFSSRDQLDLVEDYLKNKFFEVLKDVGKNNDFFYVRDFVGSLSPSYYVDEETIEKLQLLCKSIEDLDQVHKCVVELVDDMKRMLKAHRLCEEYFSQNL
jgi:hypothetical protein